MDEARLAQSVERKTLNLVVVGSSPTVGDCFTVVSLEILFSLPPNKSICIGLQFCRRFVQVFS